MIQFPRGSNWPGKTIEPNELLQEFYGPLRVAQRTTQYQWASNAFANLDLFATGENVIFAYEAVSAHFFLTSGGGPDFTSAFLWQLPYKASPVEVGDGDVALDWTSSYPEMVFVVSCLQYCRESHAVGDPLEDFFVRARIQLAIDDVRIPGCGPYTVPIEASPRGLGLAARSARLAMVTVQFLPPGAHRVSPVASQYSGAEVGNPATYNSRSAFRAGRERLEDNEPDTETVMIGSRKTIVMRCPQGRRLGA